jgi:hypothetical protein
MSGDDAQNVMMVLGLGVAPDKHPLGLATDGRLAVALRRDAEAAVLLLAADGRVRIERASEAPALGPHDDLVELPLLLWEGDVVSSTGVMPSVPAARAALGLTPGGRLVWASGVVANGAPLAEALAGAGCTRAVLLDRGGAATALRDRSGTERPPRPRYEQSVLYAVGTPLAPRAFRFEPMAAVGAAKPR